MKKMIFLLPVMVALFMTSCKKEDISEITITEAEGTVPGNWVVTYYYDNSDGVSNDFDGFEFIFSEDGTVTATNGGSVYNGFWNVQNSDDNPDYPLEIEITISGSNEMEELDGKWMLTELSETSMKLKDDSGAEEIHFEKN